MDFFLSDKGKLVVNHGRYFVLYPATFDSMTALSLIRKIIMALTCITLIVKTV